MITGSRGHLNETLRLDLELEVYGGAQQGNYPDKRRLDLEGSKGSISVPAMGPLTVRGALALSDDLKQAAEQVFAHQQGMEPRPVITQSDAGALRHTLANLMMLLHLNGWSDEELVNIFGDASILAQRDQAFTLLHALEPEPDLKDNVWAQHATPAEPTEA